MEGTQLCGIVSRSSPASAWTPFLCSSGELSGTWDTSPPVGSPDLERWSKLRLWLQARGKDMLSPIAPLQHTFESAGEGLEACLRE